MVFMFADVPCGSKCIDMDLLGSSIQRTVWAGSSLHDGMVMESTKGTMQKSPEPRGPRMNGGG